MSVSLPNNQQKQYEENTIHRGYEQANKPTTHKKQTASKSAFICDDPVSLLVDTDCILLPPLLRVLSFVTFCLDTIMKSAQLRSPY